MMPTSDRRLLAEVHSFQAEKLRRLAQLFFNAQKLVVLGDAIGARSRTGLDLSGAGGHSKIGDKGVLGLSAAVRDDRGVAVAASKLDSFEGLTHRSDLVHLD